MPQKFSEQYPDGIPVELSDEQVKAIQELADLEGRPFDDVANDVINKVLERELPGIIARKLREQK